MNNDFWHKRIINNFDPYNVFLAIATNIPVQLKTGFVVQGHILLFCKSSLSLYFIFCISLHLNIIPHQNPQHAVLIPCLIDCKAV